MKLMDRYILVAFLKNYIISLAVLIGLYVVMDMVFDFDKLIAVPHQMGQSGLFTALGVVRDVANYYFFQSFLIFVQLSGIIPVVAAAFTLMRFSRFNELTAFLAAGVPLLRVTVPIIIAALLLNGLLWVDQELILPHMIPQLSRKHDEIHTTAVKYFPIKAMQVQGNNILVAARYHPPTATIPARLEELDVLQRDKLLEPTAHIFATSAVWNTSAKDWDLTGGYKISGLLPNQMRSNAEPVSVLSGVGDAPADISLYHGSSFVDLLSTSRINQLLKHPKSYGSAGLYRVKHLRTTQPVMNVILLLLAIPTVLTFDPKMLKRAATKCLLLTGLAMGSVFVAQQIAGTPPPSPAWANAWPAMMAWMPIFAFGPLSVWLLDRVRT